MDTQETYFRRAGCEDLGPYDAGDEAGSAVAIPERNGQGGQPHSSKFTIRDLIGEAAWWRLSAAVRARFGTSPAAGERWHFRGVMDRVECSWAGRVMAWASRVTGAPVAHLTGREVPIDVLVYAEENRDGTVWERVYDFAGNRRTTARTTKRMEAGPRLLECFGLGFGMELDVYEHDAALHFRSTSFYVDVGGRRVRLPLAFSPGVLLVEHIDEGGGTFRFRMTVDHPVFGRVFFQDGVFSKVKE